MGEKWSDDSILAMIPNPTTEAYEINIRCEEITFLGRSNQPDFATMNVTMYPGKNVIELKSLKLYLQQYRDKVISYERLVNVIYDDLIRVYRPARLRVEMDLRPRGGISSHLVIDSDWSARGGQDKYRDWGR